MKLGLFTEKLPLIVSSVSLKSNPNLTPFPKKLFSETAKPTVPPSDPTPAPKEISPVGFSSTSIFTILVPPSPPSIISDLTVLNIFNDFKLFVDFALRSSLKGSPSSTSKLFLITCSSVILFPKILILSI